MCLSQACNRGQQSSNYERRLLAYLGLTDDQRNLEVQTKRQGLQPCRLRQDDVQEGLLPFCSPSTRKRRHFLYLAQQSQCWCCWVVDGLNMRLGMRYRTTTRIKPIRVASEGVRTHTLWRSGAASASGCIAPRAAAGAGWNELVGQYSPGIQASLGRPWSTWSASASFPRQPIGDRTPVYRKPALCHIACISLAFQDCVLGRVKAARDRATN